MKRKDIKTRLLLLVLTFSGGFTFAQLHFTNLDSLLSFADKNSSTSKISSQQTLLAKWTKIAAMANSVNFRNPVSFSATDNLMLPVNFIPAEAFGGAGGTFRQITLGQEYVTNFNFNPQIDIINPQNLVKIKSAGLNKEMTEVNNQLNKKALHESIAAAYFNCMALQEQISISEKSIISSDSVLFIINNKFTSGITREQDVNNARVNNFLVKDKLAQLQLGYNQQVNNLKILCDISPSISIKLENRSPNNNSELKINNNLQYKYASIQNQYAKNELRAIRSSMLPVLSLVYYQGWQKNSNVSYADANAQWIQSKYLGLRLSIPFPPDVNKISQSYTNKVNYRISTISSEHAKIQNELSNQNLLIDYEKANTTFESSKQISELKSVNYEKSINQFNEGILPADILLSSFMDLLNSKLNTAQAQANMNYNKSKILINNSLK